MFIIKRIVLLVLFVSVLFFLFFKVYPTKDDKKEMIKSFDNVIQEGGNDGIGKLATIRIEENDIRNYLIVEKNNEIKAIIAEDKLKKLKEYMQENNLMIKPGKYEIYTAAKFEKIIQILKFEKSKI